MKELMTLRKKILLCTALITFMSSCAAYASSGANTGITGLWEYPTAEMPDDGQGRIGFTKTWPYEFIFVDIAWLPWFEVNGRFSTFDSVYLDSKTDERRYMDKALDLKAVLWHTKSPEQWFIPSIAVGVMDLMGTELMKAWYGVATWRWGDFALTAGYGSDRLNGFFAGFEWDIASWLSFKAEYSPLDYTQDRAAGRRVLPEAPSQKYNVGFVLKTPWGTEGSVSYQRGDEWSFTISQRINLKGPFFGNSRKNFSAPGDSRPASWDDIDSQELIARIKSGLEHYTRVRDVDIKLSDSEDGGHTLALAYENYGYASHAEAMSRVLVVLAAVMPETDELTLTAKNAGVPVVQASFPGELLFDLRARTLREEDSIHGAVFSWASKEIEEADAERLLKNKAQHEVKAMVVYEPRLDQTLHEEYMDRWDIDLVYNGRYSKGWGGVVDIRFPVHVHADTGDGTGLWWEKDFNDKVRIQQAGMTWAHNFGSDGRAWLLGEGGYLDEEWFGANVWGRYYGKDGSWWIGARLAAMHDRDPYSFAGLTEGRWIYYYGRAFDNKGNDEWRALMFVQAGYHFTGLDFDLQAEYGQFADGDKGYKLSATRHWDDTAFGFWYIDTEVNAPGKDFTRAGVHMELPADKWFGSWFGNSSSHIWEQNTMLQSTWNSEAGRDGGVIRTPERMMSQLRPAALRKNVEALLREYCSYSDDDEEKEDAHEVSSILEYITR